MIFTDESGVLEYQKLLEYKNPLHSLCVPTPDVGTDVMSTKTWSK